MTVLSTVKRATKLVFQSHQRVVCKAVSLLLSVGAHGRLHREKKTFVSVWKAVL